MNTYIYSVIGIQLLCVSWIDFKHKTISNLWSVGNFILSLSLHLLFKESYPFSFEVFLFPAGFILFGFIFYLTGIMGAGDSKYLASLFLVIPVEYHLPYFESLATTTIMVGGVLITFKIIRNFSQLRAHFLSHHWQGLKDVIKSRFSYAPVMLLAWILLGGKLWF